MAYGTLLTDTIKSSTSGPVAFQNTSGTEIGTLCRAWVSFNGVTTVSIRGSFNVSSVTRNSSGNYNVNFSNTLADINYAIVATTGGTTAGRGGVITANTGTAGANVPPTTSTFMLNVFTGAQSDDDYINAAVFR